MPNFISDSNKNLKVIKTFKNSSSDGLSLTITSKTKNISSTQLNESSEVDLITEFSTANFTNITSQLGSVVEIPCTIHHLGEGTVSAFLNKWQIFMKAIFESLTDKSNYFQ